MRARVRALTLFCLLLPAAARATVLNPFLAVVTSTTITAQWTNVPGNNYIAVLATDPAFNSVVSSLTITNTFRSTFTALTPLITYYFEVKISTESDASYSAALSATTTGTVLAPLYSIAWGATGAGTGQFSNPQGMAGRGQRPAERSLRRRRGRLGQRLRR
jgi:hypothetical protein